VEQASIEAKENAATIVDDAVRDAAARREEAEAYFERQRAMAAEAAADFERTLGQRREKATREFQAEMAAQEGRAAPRHRARQPDAPRGRAGARERLERGGAAAGGGPRPGHEMVETARTQAERIRRESERELAAAMARRDSITSQLSNVRSMLATFGLGTGVGDDALAAIRASRRSASRSRRRTGRPSRSASRRGRASGRRPSTTRTISWAWPSTRRCSSMTATTSPPELTSGAHAEHDDQLDQMLGEERESVH
jgi:F0F1-type ATP synthase membrane subunit b/b'